MTDYFKLSLHAKTTTSLEAVDLAIVNYICEAHPRRILQKSLVKEFRGKFSRSAITRSKNKLLKLDFIEEEKIFTTFELKLKKSKIEEIKSLLSGAYDLQRSWVFRVHHLKCFVGVSYNRKDAMTLLAGKLSQDYRVFIYDMNNLKKYVVKTEFGSIVFHSSSYKVFFNIDNILIPFTVEGLDHLQNFVLIQVFSRLNAMIDILESYLNKRAVVLKNMFFFEDVHCGLLMRPDLFKYLDLSTALNDTGVFVDESIPGLKEVEKEGDLDEVLEVISFVAKDFFNQLDGGFGVAEVSE